MSLIVIVSLSPIAISCAAKLRNILNISSKFPRCGWRTDVEVPATQGQLRVLVKDWKGGKIGEDGAFIYDMPQVLRLPSRLFLVYGNIVLARGTLQFLSTCHHQIVRSQEV